MDNVSPAFSETTSPTASLQLPEAVLWDMDGTIIDTEPHWFAAEEEIARRHGATWSEKLGEKLIGMALPTSIEIFKDITGINVPSEQLIGEIIAHMVHLVRTGGAPWRPGAHQLLTSLRAHSVPCALVTMSYQDLADVVIDMLPAGTFSVVVTGDQVTNGKPDPEPYLVAAQRLGVDIEKTVALEDSIPGVTSAAASGAATIGIPAHQDLPPSDSYALLTSLEAVRPQDLLGLAGQRSG